MKRFFLFSVTYLVLAMIILFMFRDAPVTQLVDSVARTKDTVSAFVKYFPYLAVALGAIFLATRQFANKNMAKEAAWAFAGCLIFSTAFTFVKTSMPYIQPFYADVLFANWDKALHGGVDPWVWTHKFAPYISEKAVATLYFIIWGLPAAFLPFIIAATDNDEARKRRFVILYCFVWIGLGNVVALLGSSVGPVYYDRLLGGERFADLIGALGSSGIVGGKIGVVQDGLWRIYSEYSQSIGSGISAFPSVHVGVSTLTMLYLCERSKWLAPVGIAFLAAIQFCSVYIGWHYAIDGYFSFAAVLGVWFGLRIWANRRAPETQISGQHAVA
ncbi:phosphatase PAP2 family protein [uncultured Litoreibacter sp.]|uniref:phosphatase PAP2 family protein n=1 Tax=uncultured Litoreibacter sp. TaxID=1392394 RepID=UPI00262E878F|nr:phosphatase PAP2 family protein [uncultured Litoreibacter sp.]